MTYTYLKGSFRIIGSSPDDASVRFTPYDRSTFHRAGIDVDVSTVGSVRLRMEAMDAPEAGYAPPGGPVTHQPRELADGSAAQLLRLLGFLQVERDASGRVTATDPETTFGYIMSRSADADGQAVALTFSGLRSRPGLDGSEVDLGIAELVGSVNYQLVAAGWVYPAFLTIPESGLREALASAAMDARGSRAGLWAHDVSLSGFSLRDRLRLRDELVILPTVFRRVVDYWYVDPPGDVTPEGFLDYLRGRPERVVIGASGMPTTLDAVLDVQGGLVRLLVPPEQLRFIDT